MRVYEGKPYGAIFYTNAWNKSTGTTGSYQPVDVTTGFNANGALTELDLTTSTNELSAAIRPNGATYDYYQDVTHGYQPVGVDCGMDFQQQITDTLVDLWVIGLTGADGVTAKVSLTAFDAPARDAAVELRWETGSELDNLGFHIYRSASENGPYEPITTTAIPGLGSSPTDARYQYVDAKVENGKKYYYKLEDVDTSGNKTLHGPVAATPGTASPGAGVLTTGAPSNAVTYGSPSSSLDVLEHTEDHVVLELKTNGFFAEPLADGSVRLSVPGLLTEFDAGWPEIPRWRSWFRVTAGRGMRVSSVEALDVDVFSSLRPSVAPEVDVVSSRNGALRLSPRPTPTSLLQGVYPRRIAEVMGEA